jgi:hypothetical protein
MKQQIKKLAFVGVSAVALSMLIGAGTASAHSMDSHGDASWREEATHSWHEEEAEGAASSWHGEEVNADTGGHEEHAQRHQLHMKLDAALRDAAVGVAALKAELLKEPDAAALGGLVEQNNQAIADLVGEAYPDAQDEFTELWEAHIGYYKAYLTAAVAEDETGKEAAKENLAMFAEALSNVLAEANDGLDATELQEALAVHGEQVTSILDDFLAGDYEAAWATAHEAYEHMGMIAALLADGCRGHGHRHSMES